jgi:hypothetical protein
MKLLIVVALAAVAVSARAAPAPGSDTAAAKSQGVTGVTVTGEKPKKNVADPKEVICHREPVLGSLFPKEVCARREDFAERNRTDQAGTRHLQEVGQMEVLNPADKR